jgi:hypothetical protein
LSTEACQRDRARSHGYGRSTHARRVAREAEPGREETGSTCAGRGSIHADREGTKCGGGAGRDGCAGRGDGAGHSGVEDGRTSAGGSGGGGGVHRGEEAGGKSGE